MRSWRPALAALARRLADVSGRTAARLERHGDGALTDRHHARGLVSFDTRLARAGLSTLEETLRARLATTGRPQRVLEIGCGAGRLLLELLDRLGADVRLDGVNGPGWAVVRDAATLARVNHALGVMAPDRLARLTREAPPRIHLADAQRPEALSAIAPAGGFDVVVSQVVLPHLEDKVAALEAAARVLAPGGVMLHALDQSHDDPPDFLDDDLPRLTILDGAAGSARRSATAWLEARGLRVARAERAFVATWERPLDGAALDLGLTLDRRSTLDLKSLRTADGARLWGRRSAYRVVTGGVASRRA